MGRIRNVISYHTAECYDCGHSETDWKAVLRALVRIPFWLRRHGERDLYEPRHYAPHTPADLSWFDMALREHYVPALRAQLGYAPLVTVPTKGLRSTLVTLDEPATEEELQAMWGPNFLRWCRDLNVTPTGVLYDHWLCAE